jgi:hypothetical protein
MSQEDLMKLVADCNNVIMKGSYSGDDMLDAAALMLRLSGIYERLLLEEPSHESLLQEAEELPEEHA